MSDARVPYLVPVTSVPADDRRRNHGAVHRDVVLVVHGVVLLHAGPIAPAHRRVERPAVVRAGDHPDRQARLLVVVQVLLLGQGRRRVQPRMGAGTVEPLERFLVFFRQQRKVPCGM